MGIGPGDMAVAGCMGGQDADEAGDPCSYRDRHDESSDGPGLFAEMVRLTHIAAAIDCGDVLGAERLGTAQALMIGSLAAAGA